MSGDDNRGKITRRALLRGSGSVLGLSAVGTGRASGGRRVRAERRCPDASLTPEMRPCEGANADGCADDHPEAQALRTAVRRSIDRRYPTVGALIDQGYVPYFDTLDTSDSDGVSHWLNPKFIGDDVVLDPDRPESVLVDNEWWRPIGAMFIATRDGDRIENPPPVYRRGDEGDGATRCSPWHSHVGLPGRFAWWYYRQVYEGGPEEVDFPFPCRTPCMMHVWAAPNPDGVFAHGAPPREERGGPPAERPGFDTDANPEEDELDWDAVPDEVVPETKPGELAATGPRISRRTASKRERDG